MKTAGTLLFLLHLGLWLWAAGGMAEWLLESVPWPPYSNPDFPHTLLFFHWSAVLFASTGFIYGYLTRWPFTPTFMLAGYGFMGIIETFWFMTSPYKYPTMAFEFTAYILILTLLHSKGFREGHLASCHG